MTLKLNIEFLLSYSEVIAQIWPFLWLRQQTKNTFKTHLLYPMLLKNILNHVVLYM